MSEIVLRPHGRNFLRWAEHRSEVVVLSADLTSSCEMDGFRQQAPERFFSMGMAEQNMMGFAAGLAREGLSPWIHTFAVFICRRAFDQVAMSIAYSNLPVRLVGFLPGVTTPGGATHQAIDDVALMRILPNMTVLECGDATDVETVLDVAQAVDGPVYLRMLRDSHRRALEVPMKHWLFMFRPDTYEKVRAHQTVGVRDSVRKSFQQIRAGDRFVVYVSRAQLFDGYGEVTSDPFEGDTLIFADDQLYANRVRVRIDKVGVERPVGEMLWALSPFQGTLKTTPSNLIFCKGGFIEISPDDFDHLRKWMESRQA